MLKIKDYLILKRIFDYLESARDEEQEANGGFINNRVDNLDDMLVDLEKILNKLESEE